MLKTPPAPASFLSTSLTIHGIRLQIRRVLVIVEGRELEVKGELQLENRKSRSTVKSQESNVEGR